jgi:pimeloyl-ACP methyl ester carboxylesterase
MAEDFVGHNFAWREARPTLPSVDEVEAVVLLHGLGGSRISWEPQLEGLGQDFRTFAWDMPGYGSAPATYLPKGPLTFTWLATAVTAFFDELETERVHLVGISFGGMIAQYVAAQHPDRVGSLSLLSTSPKFGLDGTLPEQWRAARLAPLDQGLEPSDFADRVLSAIAGPNTTVEAMQGQRAAMKRVSGTALRRSIDCLVSHDAMSLLPSIAAPTQCIVGALDTETPPSYAKAIADLIPGATVHVVDGAGHLVNVEASTSVNELLREHFQSHSFSLSSGLL